MKCNEPVYEDSCVEFFIAFDNEGYYNFEFNAMGTCLAQYGKSKSERKFLPVSTILKIETESAIFKTKKGLFIWELVILLPLEAFIFLTFKSLKGVEANANFYKCGDKTETPHFLTWAPVDAPNPNFHVPLSFSRLLFK